MIIFACISPHPPIILPTVGSKEDRAQVKRTILALEKLGKKLKKLNPDKIIISSPHPDWGIKVPLHFLISNLKSPRSRASSLRGRQISNLHLKIQNYQSPANIIIEPSNVSTVYPVLTTVDSPKQHFEWGKKFYKSISQKHAPYRNKVSGAGSNSQKVALIASGDLSHCLKEDGPYGFHSQGPKFDRDLIESLKKKDIGKILKLDKLYPEAGQCGLRSFCFMLGVLTGSGLNWQPEILSYEAPFGVGYLVANFNIMRLLNNQRKSAKNQWLSVNKARFHADERR